MHTIFFISGAWHGASSWQNISEKLLYKGVPSFSYDTQGLGIYAPNNPFFIEEDKTVSDASQYTFESRLYKIEQQFLALYKVMGNITIVAHSLGGVFASQLINNHPEKVSKCIFVNAFMLKDQQAASDIINSPYMEKCRISSILKGSYEALGAARISLHSRDSSYSDTLMHTLYGDIKKEDFRLILNTLYADEPLSFLNHRITLSKNNFEQLEVCYIACTEDSCITYEAQRNMIKTFEEWTNLKISTITFRTGHSPMVTEKAQFVETLYKIVMQ